MTSCRTLFTESMARVLPTLALRVQGCGLVTELARCLHSRKLTWKPKKGPIKTTVLLKGYYMGFHVSLGVFIGFQHYGPILGPHYNTCPTVQGTCPQS